MAMAKMDWDCVHSHWHSRQARPHAPTRLQINDNNNNFKTENVGQEWVQECFHAGVAAASGAESPRLTTEIMIKRVTWLHN